MSTETTTPQLVPSGDPTLLPRLVAPGIDTLVFGQSIEAARLYIKLTDAATLDVDGSLTLEAWRALHEVRRNARSAREALRRSTIDREGFGEEGWNALIAAVLA